MKFQIVREKWLRGEGSSESALYTDRQGTARMCCLGFKALACGYTVDQIKDCASPGLLVSKDKDALSKGFPILPGMEKLIELIRPNPDHPSQCSGYYTTSMVGTEMIAINDRRIVDDMTNMTEEIREHKIAELFRKIGDEVEFV